MPLHVIAARTNAAARLSSHRHDAADIIPQRLEDAGVTDPHA